MHISGLLRVKGDFVATVSTEATLTEVLARLAEHGVGALVVTDDGTHILGIVSERDIVRAMHREGAAATVDRLVVMVNTRVGEPIPGGLRVGWLAELHPGVRVVEVHHDLATDFADEALWARWMALFRSHWPYPDGPHVVFSSEP